MIIVFQYEVEGQNRQARVEDKVFDRSANCAARFTDGSEFSFVAVTPPPWVTVVAEGDPGYQPELATVPPGELPAGTTVVVITGLLGDNAEVRAQKGVSFVTEGGRLRFGSGSGVMIGGGHQTNTFTTDK